MGNNEAARELEKLRAEVAALKAARSEAGTPAPEETMAATPEPGPVGDSGGIKSQLDELGELLEAEIRDLPTITCLAVFTLGILFGRGLR